MKRLCIIVIILLSTTSCLSLLGFNEETTTPTQSQVDLCRSVMYLNPSVKIKPLGFRLERGGMDDAIWFKFMTDTTDLTQVFNPEIIDVGEFEEDFAFPSWDFIEWWDVENKSLIGGEVTLPDAEYMDVGVQKTEQGYLIYIMWQDT